MRYGCRDRPTLPFNEIGQCRVGCGLATSIRDRRSCSVKIRLQYFPGSPARLGRSAIWHCGRERELGRGRGDGLRRPTRVRRIPSGHRQAQFLLQHPLHPGSKDRAKSRSRLRLAGTGASTKSVAYIKPDGRWNSGRLFRGSQSLGVHACSSLLSLFPRSLGESSGVKGWLSSRLGNCSSITCGLSVWLGRPRTDHTRKLRPLH